MSVRSLADLRLELHRLSRMTVHVEHLQVLLRVLWGAGDDGLKVWPCLSMATTKKQKMDRLISTGCVVGANMWHFTSSAACMHVEATSIPCAMLWGLQTSSTLDRFRAF